MRVSPESLNKSWLTKNTCTTVVGWLVSSHDNFNVVDFIFHQTQLLFMRDFLIKKKKIFK